MLKQFVNKILVTLRIWRQEEISAAPPTSERDARDADRKVLASPATPSSPQIALSPPPPERAEFVDAILGLDLGTSCSKVIIRTPYLGGGRAVAVPFNEPARKGSPFLVPTGIAVSGDGRIALTSEITDGVESGRSLKVRLMHEPDDPGARARAAGYLALIIRQARQWFSRSQSGVLGRRSPRWQMNLGMPSAGYDDTHMREVFTRVAVAAWRLAGKDSSLGIDDCLAEIGGGPDMEDSVPIRVVPEVVAAAVGYARSNLRVPGLHVLMDVGATTVDVCGFILHEREGSDSYALLTTSVERLGVHELHRARLGAFDPTHLNGSAERIDLSDPLVRIPESVREYAGVNCQEPSEHDETDEAFTRRCRGQFWQVLAHLRKHRYPNAPAWAEGLPIFLAGGGARMSLYGREAEQVSRLVLKMWTRIARLVIRPLPNLLNISNDGIDQELFLRLAVAYGLSFDSFNIGEIYPPDATPDAGPRPKRDMPDYISKDYV